MPMVSHMPSRLDRRGIAATLGHRLSRSFPVTVANIGADSEGFGKDTRSSVLIRRRIYWKGMNQTLLTFHGKETTEDL